MTDLASPAALVPTRPHPSRLITALRAALPGRVVGPDDPTWDLARRGWAVAVDQRPAAVVTTATAAEVATAVRIATAHGHSVSAQPVGHGATTALSGTVLLRTRGLDELHVDVARRVARVGAGVKWGELLTALEPTGLAAPAGSNPDPSVVGYILGGGLSWFGRAWGLAAHAVVAFDVIDADGTQRRVTADSDPDRFWALRGGGGDFGIVTALEIALQEAPQVYGGRLLWPIEMARPVLQAYRALTQQAPEELTAWANLFRFPADPAMPEHLRGRAFVSVDIAFLGTETEANRHLTRLRQLPGLLMDTLGPVPLGRLGEIAAEPTDPMPSQEWSGLLGALDEGTVDRLLDVVGAGADVPFAVVQVRHLGGRLAHGLADEGPSGPIEEPYLVFLLGVPTGPEAAAAIASATADVRRALATELTGRVFFNFLGEETDPSAAFGPAALDRLRRVKTAVDPGGVFRSHRPVPA
jgi:FAD/FMN-containing dehydrogenase